MECSNPAIFIFVLCLHQCLGWCLVCIKCSVNAWWVHKNWIWTDSAIIFKNCFRKTSWLHASLLNVALSLNHKSNLPKSSKYLIFLFVWIHVKLKLSVNMDLESSLHASTKQLERCRVDCFISGSIKWNIYFMSFLEKKHKNTTFSLGLDSFHTKRLTLSLIKKGWRNWALFCLLLWKLGSSSVPQRPWAIAIMHTLGTLPFCTGLIKQEWYRQKGILSRHIEEHC